ncbi:HIT family protein [Aerophototrophica crusticola]|uniref:HIT family protein n=2 Tax=Aerophototrophica crusticola TaxID=1709002 RepID=A0A858RBR1_9PROT|nr:HIT family protein [Rhodospirillaceae bacterium B3]
MQPNATMLKFGYPATLVAETEHWCVLVRPQQPTLGSLVLACKQPAAAFGQVDPAGFAGLQPVVAAAESALADLVGYQKINYLMLMMVDPDVHFHVIPRYEGSRTFEGVEFRDAGWPGQPALSPAVALADPVRDALVAALKARWPGQAA